MPQVLYVAVFVMFIGALQFSVTSRSFKQFSWQWSGGDGYAFKQLRFGILYNNSGANNSESKTDKSKSINIASSETLTNRRKPFCHLWSPQDALNRTVQPFDTWWTHHPNWIITTETEEMFCVDPGDSSSPQIKYFLHFYANQFYTSCEKVLFRPMWSSGWGADFLNVQAGLIMATESLHIPLVMGFDPDSTQAWHYSANKNDASERTCSQADLTCYFLPYHSCGSLENVELVNDGGLPECSVISCEKGKLAYQFITRKLLWLRRAVFDYKQQFKSSYTPESDCTLIHVRRADVVLHQLATRRYFPIADYVNLIPKEKLNDPNHTIFLLTDDANAIDEAHEFFPHLRWKYFKRPRFKGSSGGWENQTPSRNPAFEVIVILATLDLAQECSSFVHGHSNYAEVIWQHMQMLDGKEVQRFRVDENSHVYDSRYNASEELLEKKLEEMRRTGSKAAVTPSSTEEVQTAVTTYGSPEDHNRGNENQVHQHRYNTSTSHCSEHEGFIIANMHGRLANNLFQIALANRLSEDTCWPILFKEGWQGVFPHDSRALQCFPNGIGLHQRKPDSIVTEKDRAWFDIMNIDNVTDHKWSNPKLFFEELPHRENVHLYEKWWKNSVDEGTSLRIGSRWAFDYTSVTGWDNDLVENLRRPGNKTFITNLEENPQKHRKYDTVRAIHMDAFFIQYTWIEPWMDMIRHWHAMDESACCQHIPPENAVVIHVRNFSEEEGLDPKFSSRVYFEILDRYYFEDTPSNHVLWIVCQPQDTEIELVKDLQRRYNATIVTGIDQFDAFCTLQKAKKLVLSSHSTFSQMAALLASPETEIHYLLPKLEHPDVTLVVPHWRYHLVESNHKDSIEIWHVNASSIMPIMS